MGGEWRVLRWVSTAQGRVAAALAFALAGLVVTLVILLLRGGAPDGGGPSRSSPTTDGGGAEAWRAEVARWVAEQVGDQGIVGCDPAMCAALTTAGVPEGVLLTVRSAADVVLRADVLVVTASVRGALGAGIDPVVAPAALARVGTGASRIEVRQVAPQGVAQLVQDQAQDAAARRAAGRELVANPKLGASQEAIRQLASGEVDGRLLSVLAALAGSHKLYVREFHGGGADPGVPLRGMDIGSIDRRAPVAGSPVERFLKSQEARFRPIEVRITRPEGAAVPVLRVRYPAPSPTGLLAG